MHGLNRRSNGGYEYTSPGLITYSFPIQMLRMVTINLRCGRKVGGDEESLYDMVKKHRKVFDFRLEMNGKVRCP